MGHRGHDYSLATTVCVINQIVTLVLSNGSHDRRVKGVITTATVSVSELETAWSDLPIRPSFSRFRSRCDRRHPVFSAGALPRCRKWLPRQLIVHHWLVVAPTAFVPGHVQFPTVACAGPGSLPAESCRRRPSLGPYFPG